MWNERNAHPAGAGCWPRRTGHTALSVTSTSYKQSIERVNTQQTIFLPLCGRVFKRRYWMLCRVIECANKKAGTLKFSPEIAAAPSSKHLHTCGCPSVLLYSTLLESSLFVCGGGGGSVLVNVSWERCILNVLTSLLMKKVPTKASGYLACKNAAVRVL
jgi:hypothetical protein